jgi:hypothetical protein
MRNHLLVQLIERMLDVHFHITLRGRKVVHIHSNFVTVAPEAVYAVLRWFKVASRRRSLPG